MVRAGFTAPVGLTAGVDLVAPSSTHSRPHTAQPEVARAPSADSIVEARPGANPSVARPVSAGSTVVASEAAPAGEGSVADSTAADSVEATAGGSVEATAVATADSLPDQRRNGETDDVDSDGCDARAFSCPMSGLDTRSRGCRAADRAPAVECRRRIGNEDVPVRGRRLGGPVPGRPEWRWARARGGPRRRRGGHGGPRRIE